MKAKLKFVVEIEYDMNPEYYPNGETPEEMLAIDLAGANDDPLLTLDNPSAKWVITGEIIN